MKKLGLLLLSLFYPALLFAQDQSGGGSLSFAPPPGDYSVVFLGNIFGVVDGVLHGSGSQIMGTMFGVFNSAVLALGGIVIMYTLTVSTMNTAQEGQFLGQKWSSIWVPVRSTLGLALLIPKASGYCMMQVFIMWVVVQGVGAADKIWDAALGYLNQGGAIIKAQMKPAVSLTAGGTSVAQGAFVILSGQVCMAGIQQILYEQRQSLMEQKSQKIGPCYGTPSSTMAPICNAQVPDLVGSVNAVSFQTSQKTAKSFTMPLPNLDSTSPYSVLNGICGSLTWNAFSTGSVAGLGLNSGDLQTMEISRAIAIQQMYTDLASIAQQIVSNDPQLNTSAVSTTQQPFSPVATEQYGVPYSINGNVCTSDDIANNQCVSWGSASSSTTSSAPLFNGTAFQGAVQDYNAVMQPSLTLVQEATNKKNASKEREFIKGAEQQGWILAGSYFWDLVQLNTSAMNAGSNLTDSDTGLDGSKFSVSTMTSAFGNAGTCAGTYQILCTWLQSDVTQINQLKGLFDASSFSGTAIPQPNTSQSGGESVKSMLAKALESGPITGQQSATVFGFITNSLKVQLPDQPGFKPPSFNLQIKIDLDGSLLYLPSQNFSCGHVPLLGCVGRLLGNLFYNDMIRVFLNFFLDLISKLLDTVIFAFISLPLEGIAEIFKQGVSIIEQPNANPIVALANMGTQYINFAGDLWILLIEVSLIAAIPYVGGVIFAIIALTFPLLFAWLGTMVSIGFITAYYIPFMPYMIFTFGSIAWLMAVIEAMVAGPIVALGITHPEGDAALGRGEQALMILLNVFLRPAMMIIGYITAIALSYVAVWILNAGYQNVANFILGSDTGGGFLTTSSQGNYGFGDPTKKINDTSTVQSLAGTINPKGYTSWAGIYGFFFVILMYTTMYMIMVQKSFSLITMLPDKVLRFIGGPPESVGQETAQWGQEAQQKVQEGAGATQKASQAIDSKLGGYAEQGIGKIKGAASSFAGAQPNAKATFSGDNE
ncbi:type IVB secretion system protein DotA [Legionella sp. W05-934-2]|uniref:type IVB secretion system protein DotA n=1 Tax=Legionella sp. W05-934-2 TaxID=1198649 RepID=UPI0034636AE6